MGSKAALHPTVFLSAIRPVVSGRGAPHRRRLVAGLVGAALFLPLILTVLCRPVYCRVNGAPRLLWRDATAASALAASGARPGNLYDLHGALLRPQGGSPPVVLRRGLPLPPDTPLGQRDRLTVLPGADAREPVREHVELLPQAEARGYRPAAVAGTQRLQVGLLSGQAAYETVRAVPAVVATTTPPSRPFTMLIPQSVNHMGKRRKYPPPANGTLIPMKWTDASGISNILPFSVSRVTGNRENPGYPYRSCRTG